MHVQTKDFSPNACKNLIFAFSHVLKVILQNQHVSKLKQRQVHVLKVEIAPSACPQSGNSTKCMQGEEDVGRD